MDAEAIRRIVEEQTEVAGASGSRYRYRRDAARRVEQSLLGTGAPAVVLDGPRRTGKTVALEQLTEQLRAMPDVRVHYCDFTDIRLRGVGIQDLVAALIPRGARREPRLLLLDEVHYSGESWARELKFAVDHSGARIAVADSAVAVVNAKLREELAGRYELVRMHPLSFRESRDLRSSEGFPIASEDDPSQLAHECDEYLQLGGFPANAARRGYLQEVQESLRNAVIAQAVRDDLGRLRGLRDIDNLERVFVARLANSGAQLNVRDDAKQTGASEPTVRNWLQGMLDTGLLWRLEAHVRSAGRFERGQPAKLYAVDPSLVGACSLPVFCPGNPEQTGRQLETAVAQALRRYCEITGARCGFHQPKGRAGQQEGEVDFVVEHGNRRYAIEVTSSKDRRKIPQLSRMARDLDVAFTAVVSRRTGAEAERVDGQTIHLVPLHEFLLRMAAAQEKWPW
jgi:predicted AAA+ superfamily ATPase